MASEIISVLIFGIYLPITLIFDDWDKMEDKNMEEIPKDKVPQSIKLKKNLLQPTL